MSAQQSQGYAITFNGHGTFTPEGRTGTVHDVAEHNRALEAEELHQWEARPERWHVYVQDAHAVGGGRVTTWLGTVLGTITYAHTFRHNFGGRMTSIRFKGTNGATYSGRFGSDWSQLCRVRKVRP